MTTMSRMNGYGTINEHNEAAARAGAAFLSGSLEPAYDVIEREKVSNIFLPLAHIRNVFNLSLEEFCLLSSWMDFCMSGEKKEFLFEFHRRCTAMFSCGKDLPLSELLWLDRSGRYKLLPIVEDFLFCRVPRLPFDMILSFPEKMPELFHDKKIFQNVTDLLCRQDIPEPLAIILTGKKGIGKSFLARSAAYKLNRAFLSVSAVKQYSQEALQVLIVTAILYDALVCLIDFPGTESHCAELLAVRLGKIILTTGEEIICDFSATAVFHRSLSGLTVAERRLAMESLFSEFRLPSEISLEVLAGTGRFQMAHLVRLVQRLTAEYCLGIRSDSFYRSLHDIGYYKLPDSVNVLPVSRKLGELVLPEQQKKQLTEICIAAQVWRSVYEEWGFGNRISYGKGMTILFYGAPGTGKTMAAEVLSGELGLELWRVDITRLISKYIGETQKNISAVFHSAKGQGCLLFFDEADALFSRRSEVSDAQDRYANAEIACLLQQTERFDGITVLATNLLQNFDEAFRRRITHMVRFPAPDIPARELLWKGIFPAEAPVGDLDYLLLAEAFELTGAEIKNSAVFAACLAKSEGAEIGMRHIFRAVQNEYLKQGKTAGFPFPIDFSEEGE